MNVNLRLLKLIILLLMLLLLLLPCLLLLITLYLVVINECCSEAHGANVECVWWGGGGGGGVGFAPWVSGGFKQGGGLIKVIPPYYSPSLSRAIFLRQSFCPSFVYIHQLMGIVGIL